MIKIVELLTEKPKYISVDRPEENTYLQIGFKHAKPRKNSFSIGLWHIKYK